MQTEFSAERFGFAVVKGHTVGGRGRSHAGVRLLLHEPVKLMQQLASHILTASYKGADGGDVCCEVGVVAQRRLDGGCRIARNCAHATHFDRSCGHAE